MVKTILVITAVVVALAVLGGGGWYVWHSYSQHKAKVEAAKGNPAAMVAAPTAASASAALDVLMKMHQAYTHLSSLNVEGTAVMVIDMSQVTAADMNPNQTAAQKKAAEKKPARRPPGMPKAMTNKTDVVIKLARPDLYRIEGTAKMAAGPTIMTNTTAVWSSGKTNFTLMMMGGGAYKNFTTVANRKQAFLMNGQAGALVMAIPELFFDEAGDMDKFIQDWGQTDDEAVSGQDCYTLTGKILGQKLKIWVSKTSYMILQSEITLGAPVSDDNISTAIGAFDTNTKRTQAQLDQEKTMAKQQAGMMTKIRGTITETYANIETNNTFAAADFNYPVPRGVRLTPSRQDSSSATTTSASSTEVSQRNACINNLRQIDAAKNQYALENRKTTGDAVTEADIKPYIKLDADGNLPKCPSGGKYTIGKVGETPTCSIDGHVLP